MAKANELHHSMNRLKREYGQTNADDMTITIAADFLCGGAPSFARAFDRRGSLVGTTQRI